ncbi:glycoside hydrolase family 127 protein [bacterium]|nr:glycoside hydrolase family 127 protein [bacterium]
MAFKVHTYRYFSRCLNQCDLYRIDPDERLLEMSRYTLEKMLDRTRPGMFISGATGRQEGWVDDQNGQTKIGEYCAIAYQIWWLGRLIEIDGTLQYGDIIERTLLNHVYAAQNPEDGRERYFVNINGKRSYEKGAHCCQGNFHRSLARMPEYIFYTLDNGIAVNLYASCETEISIEGMKVRLEQRTDYPVSGDIEMTIEPSQEKDFALRLRIPKWAGTFNVTVNKQPVVTKQVKGGVEIRRKWKKGDAVRLELPMESRWIQGRGFNEGYYALMRGPQVFCLSERYNPNLKDYSWRDITVDPESLGPPSQEDQRVKQRNGLMCTATGWSPTSDRSQPADVNLVFTDFPEESAMETYYKLPDATDTMEDELYR